MSSASRILAVSFASQEDLRREYAANIANAGIFVPTAENFDVGESVRVEFQLAYCNDSLSLEGTVVHAIPVDLAPAGATPGVAVEFDLPASEVKQLFSERAQVSESALETHPDPERAKRRAPRGKASLSASLRTASGEHLNGRVRNLSRDGALVALSGEAPPVGGRVVLSLAAVTAEGGDAMEIPGRVARRVEGDDSRIAAIGIEFELPEDRRDALRDLLESLRQTEHRKQMGGVSGSVAELGLTNLLHTFGMAAPEGTLTVYRGGEEAVLAFAQNHFRLIRVGSIVGLKALTRLLGWSDGRFEFHARVDPDILKGDPEHIPLQLEAAMLEALRLVDESRRTGAIHFPSQARVAVVRADEPEDEVEKAVMARAAGSPTVGELLDAVCEPDPVVLAAMGRLVERAQIEVR